MTNSTINPKKIQWKCRRGMLELDIILNKFFETEFSQLTDSEKRLFDRFLDHPDPLLYDWLLGHDKPSDSKDLIMTNKIRKTTAS